MSGEVVEDKDRLANSFNLPLDQYDPQWNTLWLDNFMPWDKGFASPSLVDLLSPPAGTTTTPAIAAIKQAQSKANKKAVVPGCGKGYDVKLLAEHGYEAYGLDIAPKAVELARGWYKENGEGKGKVGFVLGDFFKDDWVKKEVFGGGEGKTEGALDLIYDYTFLCALHPTMRPAWAKQMAYLLAPGTGLLICLEFPLYKGLELPGPPWPLRSHIYDELLSEDFELVERFKPERTHEIGEGTDNVSVWRKKA